MIEKVREIQVHPLFGPVPLVVICSDTDCQKIYMATHNGESGDYGERAHCGPWG
jgi:hypothetical protein